jgi:predicted nucleotidyltransferase
LALSDRQIETWASPGAQTTAAATYASIKAALEASTSLIRNRDYEVYLQGSYRNGTNVYGDSDVDVVVELNETYGYDISELNQTQKAAFDRQFIPASYSYQEFRNDVQQSLERYYGSRLVESHNKCIKVLKDSGRLDADVVPAQKYRLYRPSAFYPSTLPQPIEGIRFFTQRENRQVVNYPKRHYQNGVEKNQATEEWYKPTVRIYKNVRNYLQAEGLIPDGAAPSYFVECLLFNVPNAKFGKTLALSFGHSLIWLARLDDTSLGQFLCGNGIVRLFGPTPEQWNVKEARQFINACLTAAS